jgi:hypothetical protein
VNGGWEDYVFAQNRDALDACAAAAKNARSLYVVGEGFDPRALTGLRRVLGAGAPSELTVLSLSLAASGSSTSPRARRAVANVSALTEITRAHDIELIRVAFPDVHERRALGRAHLRTMLAHDAFERCEHVMLDISALPTGVYFGLIGGLLTLADRGELDRELQVLVAENVELDHLIRGQGSETPAPIIGFRYDAELAPAPKRPILVWAPVLGPGSDAQLEALYNSLVPDEICPVLPFPARNPRRPDQLLLSLRHIVVDHFEVEPSNYIYADERNPFDLYRTLSRLNERYRRALSPLGDTVVVVSLHSSKTLSLGALLAAHQHRLPVMNAEPEHYEFDEHAITDQLLADSELLCAWLAGTPTAA